MKISKVLKNSIENYYAKSVLKTIKIPTIETGIVGSGVTF